MIKRNCSTYIHNEIAYQKTYHFLDAYMSGPVCLEEYTPNPQIKENKTIWIFWMQGLEEAPELIRKCVKSVECNKPHDFDLVVITEKNIDTYVCLPSYIWEKYRSGNITRTHLSDILRLELLTTYGGCWVDATVYCSEQIPRYFLDGELFFFRWTLLQSSVLKGSSWWIYAKKGQRIITQTREVLYRYWKKEKYLRNYYLLHIALSKVIDSSVEYQAVFYYMPYVCNSNAHALYLCLSTEYDSRRWETIRDNSKVHKLSYKKRFIRGGTYNFYTALLDDKLR